MYDYGSSVAYGASVKEDSGIIIGIIWQEALQVTGSMVKRHHAIERIQLRRMPALKSCRSFIRW